MEHCDVIIVGAGLSGLTAANALVQSGKSVRVVEVDDAIDDRGAGLGISPSGMSSLESLGPQIFDEVKACSQPAMSQARVFTKEGLPKSPDCTDMPDCTKHAESYGPEGAKGLMMVNWYMLRRILIRGLPSGSLMLGMRHTGYEEDADGVTLTFEGRPPIRGALLLGADGALSGIRRQCLGDKQPLSVLRVCWHGVIPGGVGELKEGDDGRSCHLWLDPSLRVGGVCRIPGPGGSLQSVWMCTVPGDPDLARRVEGMRDGREVLQLMLRMMDGFDEALLGPLRRTAPENVEAIPLYQRPPSLVWGRGRVTLLGDAAHLMPPQYGIATSMALEDAIAVATSVARQGLGKAALRCYERRRVSRVVPLQVAMASLGRWKFCPSDNGRMSPIKRRLMTYIHEYTPEPFLDLRSEASGTVCGSPAHKRPCCGAGASCKRQRAAADDCCDHAITSAPAFP